MPAPVKYSDRELLDRAVEQFWIHGYGATTIRDLEAALDVTAPSIYHRFATKDALFDRVVDHYIETVIETRIARYLGATADPLVDLYRFFRTAQSPRGCLLTTTAIEVGPTSSVIRASIERGFEIMRAGLLRETTRAGRPAEVAQALLIDMQGLMVMSRLGVATEQLRRRTRVVFALQFGAAFQPRG